MQIVFQHDGIQGDNNYYLWCCSLMFSHLPMFIPALCFVSVYPSSATCVQIQLLFSVCYWTSTEYFIMKTVQTCSCTVQLSLRFNETEVIPYFSFATSSCMPSVLLSSGTVTCDMFVIYNNTSSSKSTHTSTFLTHTVWVWDKIRRHDARAKWLLWCHKVMTHIRISAPIIFTVLYT